MCSKPKITTVEQVREEQKDTEIIKNAVQADASKQKANAENRIGKRGLISDNIRTTNNGLNDEDVLTSKKKLLGE